MPTPFNWADFSSGHLVLWKTALYLGRLIPHWDVGEWFWQNSCLILHSSLANHVTKFSMGNPSPGDRTDWLLTLQNILPILHTEQGDNPRWASYLPVLSGVASTLLTTHHGPFSLCLWPSLWLLPGLVIAGFFQTTSQHICFRIQDRSLCLT